VPLEGPKSVNYKTQASQQGLEMTVSGFSLPVVGERRIPAVERLHTRVRESEV
jgi:hypothetical protein